MEKHTIGIGIIGMGWMGMTHARAYRQIADRFHDSPLQPKLVICADDVVERTDEAETRFEFERTTTDYRQVIEDKDVQVVNIAAPNNMHLEIVEAAAAAKKHVFCEKPVGRSPAETKAIYAAAQRAGIFTGVGYNYRWAPVVQYAHQLISDGKLGTLTHYRGRFFAGYAAHPRAVLSWRFQKEIAGLGTLGDLISHVVDMAHFIVGDIDSVVSQQETFIPQRPVAAAGTGTHFTLGSDGKIEAVTNEDYVGALVRFENGVRGTLEACRVINGPKCEMAFEVNGTEGALRWNFEQMNELDVYLPNENGSTDGYTRILSGPSHPLHADFNPGPAVGLGYDDLKTIEAYQFLQAIHAGKQANPGFREAAAVADVQTAIQISWEEDRWISV
ncbi:MAG: Gfo/Idh/MocA family oxidoreductase [Candidatus Poribacteria bacterium]|nr:Gfo/Idh/MocA family oxidoreductase [Candidatus Poribacteria bacterium]